MGNINLYTKYYYSLKNNKLDGKKIIKIFTKIKKNNFKIKFSQTQQEVLLERCEISLYYFVTNFFNDLSFYNLEYKLNYISFILEFNESLNENSKIFSDKKRGLLIYYFSTILDQIIKTGFDRGSHTFETHNKFNIYDKNKSKYNISIDKVYRSRFLLKGVKLENEKIKKRLYKMTKNKTFFIGLEKLNRPNFMNSQNYQKINKKTEFKLRLLGYISFRKIDKIYLKKISVEGNYFNVIDKFGQNHYVILKMK